MPPSESHIPPLPEGVFAVSASSLIDAPIADVWNIILDFGSYKEWNPFVRGQTIVDSHKNPLPDQTPAPGRYLLIAPVHLPPTMGDPGWFGTSSAFTRIKAIEHENHRAAWHFVALSGFLLRSERWQALSIDLNGKTKYETTEVFYGIVAWLVYFFVGTNLTLGFNAQAEALKHRAERLHKAT
ncbi:hypothetical protein AX15_001236 [Amanita polypyramis BW_CC]|nr:hypothetical protein AX15_001236 [Amanita polypyramis BW_CC]